jgi:hypothetical protein
MKRQDILEIIVSNPQAIFVNANWQAGKYSEYPSIFQVTGMTADKSYVWVKRVSVTTEDWVLNGDTSLDIATDEQGKWIPDTRPVAERTHIVYGDTHSMPTRLVLKSDKTEQGMIDELVAKKEQTARENAEREEQYEKHTELMKELNSLLYGFNILTFDDKEIETAYNRRAYFNLNQRQIEQLVSVLKTALDNASEIAYAEMGV